MKNITQRSLMLVGILVALVVSSGSVFAMVPGDTIPSQKLNYIDPVSGKKCARLTTMGVSKHTTVFCGQDSSAETQQWSADSKSVLLWFNVPPYPKGIYQLSVETGLMKYLAPIGNSQLWCNHAQFNPRDPNEVIYLYGWKGSKSFVEIRGVKTVAPYTVRTIRRFDGISSGGPMLSMSHDGKFCYVLVTSPKGRIYGVVVNMLTQKDHPDFPYRGPNWNHKDGMCDGPIWNPKNNKAILWQVPIGSSTVKKIVCYDFDTGKSTPSSCPTSHATWSADGKMTISPFGVISDDNRALGKDGLKGTKTAYFVYKHPFANPAEGDLGKNGHIIGDFVGKLNGARYIHYFTVNDIMNVPFATLAKRKENRLGYWWGDESDHVGHPHMQMSPNGQYVVWVSNVRNSVGDLPPGPKNTGGKGSNVDVFMMEVNPVQSTSKLPAAPSSLAATTKSSTQINISWKDQANNETGYQIERKTGAGGAYTQIATVGADVESFSNVGLAANTQYTYRVRATNAKGNSAYSNEANATTKEVAPAAPTGLTAKVVSSSQINLSWADHSNNETGFRIERKAGFGKAYSQIATVGAGVKTFKNTSLTANMHYYYRVRATNGAGNSAYSNQANATTPPVVHVTSAPIISSPATVASPVNASFQYQIKASGTPTSYGATGLPVGLSVDTATGLISGSPIVAGLYDVTLSATNAGGTSTVTLKLTIKGVSMAEPVNLTAVVVGTTVNLAWSDNSTDETSFRVFRKDGVNGTWGYCARIEPNTHTFSDTSPKSQKIYFYRVRVRKGDSSSEDFSDWSNEVKVAL